MHYCNIITVPNMIEKCHKISATIPHEDVSAFCFFAAAENTPFPKTDHTFPTTIPSHLE